MEPTVKPKDTTSGCGQHSEDTARVVVENEGPPGWGAPLGGAWTQRDQGGGHRTEKERARGEMSEAGWPAACGK